LNDRAYDMEVFSVNLLQNITKIFYIFNVNIGWEAPPPTHTHYIYFHGTQDLTIVE